MLDNHFFFNLAGQKTESFYFIDSIEQDRLDAVFSTLNLIAKFLNNLDIESTEIKRAEKRFVIQPDSASCGVCLCMVVQMICDKLENDAKVDDSLRSEKCPRFETGCHMLCTVRK